MTKEEEKIWELALKAFEEITQEIGFEDRKTAYLQRFFAGFKEALKKEK